METYFSSFKSKSLHFVADGSLVVFDELGLNVFEEIAGVLIGLNKFELEIVDGNVVVVMALLLSVNANELQVDRDLCKIAECKASVADDLK